MKNFTLLFNIVLAVAVAVLFYLHFSYAKKTAGMPAACAAKGNGTFKIAYFEMDSVQNNYDYFKQVAKELSALEQAKRSELEGRKNSVISKMKEYQGKFQSMSPADQQKAQQDMEQRQKDYQAFEASKGQELQDENFKKLQEVKKKIEDYLKDFSKQNGYSFVFANNTNASEMYYKDTVYNITSELVKGLNESYKKKN